METKAPSRSFDQPREADWHRGISEAAYFIAMKRGFTGDHSLEDWLTAEQQMRQVISPASDSGTKNDTTDA
jgi:Protein of unknown function (DUF2934)